VRVAVAVADVVARGVVTDRTVAREVTLLVFEESALARAVGEVRALPA
jgi:hypothetical protein